MKEYPSPMITRRRVRCGLFTEPNGGHDGDHFRGDWIGTAKNVAGKTSLTVIFSTVIVTL